MINTDFNNMINNGREKNGRWRWFVSFVVTFISVLLLYRASPGNNLWTDTASWSVNSWEVATAGIELFFAAVVGFSYWRMIFRDLHGEMYTGKT